MATESTSKIPWREGYWKMDAFSSNYGNIGQQFSVIQLGCPRLSPNFQGEIQSQNEKMISFQCDFINIYLLHNIL